MNIQALLIALFETLGMTLIGTILAYVIGFPLGVILNVTSKNGIKPNKYINTILGTIVNIMRSIPCVLLIVVLLPLTRLILGKSSGEWYVMIIPIFVAAFGFVSRLVEGSLNEVDGGVIEAAKSMGASTFQIITKVLLPETRASLISGLAVTLVSILGYTSFAYNIGAGGLIAGIWKFYSKNTGDYLSEPFFWIMIVIVILIVQGIQELGLLISKKIDKRRIL